MTSVAGRHVSATPVGWKNQLFADWGNASVGDDRPLGQHRMQTVSLGRFYCLPRNSKTGGCAARRGGFTPGFIAAGLLRREFASQSRCVKRTIGRRRGPFRTSVRSQNAQKEEVEMDSNDLSLEDVVKDVVASRLERANGIDVTELHNTTEDERSHSHQNAIKDERSHSHQDATEHERSHSHQNASVGQSSGVVESGVKIDVAPKVLEALRSTGELGDGESLFDLVEKKRRKRLAEKSKAKSNSLVNRIKGGILRLKWFGGLKRGGGKKQALGKREGVNYRMDMDFVQKPPLEADLDQVIEFNQESLPEFNEHMRDVLQPLVNLGLASDPDDQLDYFLRMLSNFGECLTGVNGQTLDAIPTPLADKVVDAFIVPGRRKVSGADFEEFGLTRPLKTVEARQLQQEVFRSGPFYAQWYERWRSGWVVTGYLEGNPAEVRERIQARLDQHFPELRLVVFLLNTPQEVPWCLIIPEDEPMAFFFLPELRQAVFASAVVSALVMWICKGIAIADPLLLNGEEAAIALAALPLGLLAILFTGSIARSAVASLYGVRDSFPIPIPMPGLGAIGMTFQNKGVLPSRAALIDIPLAGSLATAAASIAMITSSHSWLAWRFPQTGPLILVPPETLHHSFVLSYLVFQLQKASIVGPDDVIYMAIHPLAFAGLLGLNATALSLLPFTKTDGGRITEGLFGREGHSLAQAATYMLVVTGLVFGDTPLSFALLAYNFHLAPQWYQKDEVSDIGFVRTLIAFVTLALGVIVLSPTFSWIPFHSLVKTANHVQTTLPAWGNL